jgi:O-glycosyl hydrolase
MYQNRHTLIPILILVASLMQAAAAAQINLAINASAPAQTIEGFGACLFLGASHPYDETWYQDLYARDLGCSIVRMELTPWVLGPDVTKPVRLGDDIEANIRLMDFSAAGGPSAAKFIRAVNAKKLDRLLLIGSLWTPPHWMKDGAIVNFGNSSGGHLRMDADNLEQFGRYVSAYVKGFERFCGVPFYAISLQNELMFKEAYNSCQYTPAEYHDAVRAVGRAFARYGITAKIMGPEGVAPFGDYFIDKQMGWINAVQDDPETAGYLSFFCGHGSGEDISDQQNYWKGIEGFGKESWVTEWSGESPDWIHSDQNGKPDGALAMAWHLHQILAGGNASAAVYWQCSDGRAAVSDQNLMGNTPQSAADSAKFAVARQFFRYIRPGSVRLAVQNDLSDLGTSAFIDPKNHALVIVLVNQANQDRDVRLSLPALPNLRIIRVFRTTATERFAAHADLVPTENAISLSIPAESVTTLYGQ